MNNDIIDININDYDYELPEDRIAQYPVAERDSSQLLIHKNNRIFKDTFSNIAEFLPSGSLLVFNNTRVIRARMLFRKKTGAVIEILCLEPLSPADYSLSFNAKLSVEWKCIVGNLKKWKKEVLTQSFKQKSTEFNLNAEKIKAEGDAWRIKFSWDNHELSFCEVIEAAGHIPLPPYINREDQKSDSERYQTVYSSVDGSVAAPTAGLHFTEKGLRSLEQNGISKADVTLHVGAGTFQPVKVDNAAEHEMHCEHFVVEKKTIQLLINNIGNIIPVGTTSVRTIESLYWIGVKIIQNKLTEFSLEQWEAYNLPSLITPEESLKAVLDFLEKNKSDFVKASTKIMIVPGYKFMLTNGLITNFHQPRSTLLLLISAWIGSKWKDLYKYALNNNFSFLSYGDSSLLLR